MDKITGLQELKKKINQGDPHSEHYGRVQAIILSEDSGLCDVMLIHLASGYQQAFHLKGARGPRCLNLLTREDLHTPGDAASHPEDRTPQLHRCENLKTRTLLYPLEYFIVNNGS